MKLTIIQLENLKLIVKAALEGEHNTGLPAQLTVAQCILESAWLQNAPANNCFGIKDTDRFPNCHYSVTKEFINGQWETSTLKFEAYPTLAACFTDHSRLITTKNPYAKAWRNYQDYGSLIQLISEVAKVYATDPNYEYKLFTILSMTEVNKAIFEEKVRGVII